MANGLDRGVGPKLLPQPSDADFYDVRAGLEGIAPDLGEQAFAADHFTDVQDEMMEQPKLAVGEFAHNIVEARLSPREVEDEPSAA
jgi:hypothetical protein